ncbi:hypothetical protein PybrP1_004180 [[Pythium] brassicae (nom. inval.)]|nr:hypothetical protein PybrP1_004180 [[Pythium] brassicae (nom. inval.)]
MKAALVDVPPLHAAVWAGDVNRVRAILQEARAAFVNYSNGSSEAASVVDAEDDAQDVAKRSVLERILETKDAYGNSALHLAVRIVQPAQRAIVQLLLEHGASVSSRNLDGWSCVHDATLCDDEFLLAHLFLRGEQQLWSHLRARQEAFFCALERLPDFEAEIFLEAHSWVPMVSKILPSDTIRIWKRGSQLRVDSALKGLDGAKWKRGKMSHMFMGRHSERPGHAVVVDHEGGTFYDVTAMLRRSTVTSMDLGLQMLLTTPLSTSALDSSTVAFHKRKEITAAKLSKKLKQAGASAPKRGGFCPWTGTKYKMEGFTVSAQFRPVVKPGRKLQDATAQASDAPLKEIQQFVSHLSIHSAKSATSSEPKRAKAKKNKSMRNTNFDSDDDRQELERERKPSVALDAKDPRRRSSTSAAAEAGRNASSRTHRSNGSQESSAPSQTLLRLAKGKKVEMHLDVCAGDTVGWSFTAKSKEFCFTATYFHDDQKLPVCQTDGVKNIAVAGAFEAEHNGSFVLMWLNTQKNFSLDVNGIKILYDVTHTRPSLGLPAPSNGAGVPMAANRLPETVEGGKAQGEDENKARAGVDASDEAPEPSDAERCEYFLRLDHLPNPLTATTSFHDYFRGPQSLDDGKKASKMSSLFKRSNQQKKPSHDDGHESDVAAASGERNTFRSLTVLPETRRLGKEFEAKLVMADSFPFQLTDFLPVIEFLSHTGEHVKNLEEFFRLKLPPGFPVRFELPMMFTVRIAYTFQKITLSPTFEPGFFDIPHSYGQVFTLKEVRS